MPDINGKNAEQHRVHREEQGGSTPRKLLDVLHLFDGQRTTDAAVEEIANRTDIEMERSLLRKLVDFGVLTPVPATLTPSGPA